MSNKNRNRNNQQRTLRALQNIPQDVLQAAYQQSVRQFSNYHHPIVSGRQLTAGDPRDRDLLAWYAGVQATILNPQLRDAMCQENTMMGSNLGTSSPGGGERQIGQIGNLPPHVRNVLHAVRSRRAA